MPLRYLFIDMNSYFASVEQQDDPKLRGRPVAVVPVEAGTSCCIAASREAKRFGIRTGTAVWQAKRLCPELVCVTGNHERYVQVHKQIVKAVGRCAPVERVMSIDEMACKLIGVERRPENAEAIARKIKAELRRTLGEVLTCSIGVGPNVMLAKVAGDMRKPDGLTFLHPEQLPDNLYPLKITDFPGIGPRMEKRFHRYGVTTTRQLLGLTVAGMSRVWESKVMGERWFHLLRGEDVPDLPTKRRTVSHSHILPPDLRTEDGSRGVMVRLIHKAAARLRSIGYWAGFLGVSISYLDGPRWGVGTHLPKCQDTLNMLLAFGKMWDDPDRPRHATPLKVSMVLSELVPAAVATPSLFEQDRQVTTLSHVMDKINRAFGKHSVRFGTVMGSEDTAPTRVAFTRIPDPNPAHD